MTLSALVVPSTAGAGGTIIVSDTTQNSGGGGAPPSTTRFYLSSNFTLDTADIGLGGRAVSALAAGASQASTTALTLPATMPTGTYYVLAQADGTAALAETVEANNVRSSAPVRVGPDLAMTALTVPSSGGAGGPVVVSDTTRNQGGGAAPASVTTFHLSTNLTLDAGDVPLGSRPVASLPAGGVDSGSALFTIPVGTLTGAYYVLAQADGTGTVVETAETNNTRLI